jgi:hypothetical protein
MAEQKQTAGATLDSVDNLEVVAYPSAMSCTLDVELGTALT